MIHQLPSLSDQSPSSQTIQILDSLHQSSQKNTHFHQSSDRSQNLIHDISRQNCQQNTNKTPFQYTSESKLAFDSQFFCDKFENIKFSKEKRFPPSENPSQKSWTQVSETNIFSVSNNKLGSTEQKFGDMSQESSTKNILKNLNINNKQWEQNFYWMDKQKCLSPETQQTQKSYTSYLHEIVDRNHSQSPSHKLKIQPQNTQEFEEFRLQEVNNETHEDKTGSQKNIHQEKQNAPQKQFPYKNQPLTEDAVIKPVLIQQVQQVSQVKKIKQKNVKKEKQQKNEKNSSSDSPTSSPGSKAKNYRVQFRKIPQTLCGSYEELQLTINKNEQPLKSSPVDSPIKLKQKFNYNQEKKSKKNQKQMRKDLKSHLGSTKSLNNHDEELLAKLSIFEGYCRLELEDQGQVQTKFIINKSEVFFQAHKKVLISRISKVKFVKKEEGQVKIKVTYEPQDPKKKENLILQILPLSLQQSFAQSYEFFSQIVLRKLLLMNLFINEVNQKNYSDSPRPQPTKSPVVSPIDSPTIKRKVSNTHSTDEPQVILYEAELFKKSSIFNSWQKKYFILNENALKSYNYEAGNRQKGKSSSSLNKSFEIWTRFQLIYGYLVVKMWQSKIEKIQMGVPLCDFTNIEGKNNWLYGLSKLIVWRKNEIEHQTQNN